MTWASGQRRFKKYSSLEKSYDDFKRIWEKNYKVFPRMEEAKKWTGNDQPGTWLAAVTQYYND